MYSISIKLSKSDRTLIYLNNMKCQNICIILAYTVTKEDIKSYVSIGASVPTSALDQKHAALLSKPSRMSMATNDFLCSALVCTPPSSSGNK